MGFSSWSCRGCGHPMLSGHVTNPVNRWMSDVVVMSRRGTILSGYYDGYGRVDEREIPYRRGAPECWHRACYEVAGRPVYS